MLYFVDTLRDYDSFIFFSKKGVLLPLLELLKIDTDLFQKWHPGAQITLSCFLDEQYAGITPFYN